MMEQEDPPNHDVGGDTIALIWLLQNASLSNVDVAYISNVCRQWRKTIVSILVAEVMMMMIATTSHNSSCASATTATATSTAIQSNPVAPSTASLSKPPSSFFTSHSFLSSTRRRSCCIQRLFITDMAREMMFQWIRRTTTTTINQNNNHHHQPQQKKKQGEKYYNSNDDDDDTTSYHEIGKKDNNRNHHHHNNNNNNSCFCLAWFAPSGIQTISIPMDDSSPTEEEEEEGDQIMHNPAVDPITANNNNNNNHVDDPTLPLLVNKQQQQQQQQQQFDDDDVGKHPSSLSSSSRQDHGNATKQGSILIKEKKNRMMMTTTTTTTKKNKHEKKKKNSKKIVACLEWRGYRHATQVLCPFGYATAFIHDVMDATRKQWADKYYYYGTTTPTDAAQELTQDVRTSQQQKLLTTSTHSDPPKKAFSSSAIQRVSSHKYNPTFAVRGSTLARPEGYCLCLDNEYISEYYNNSTNPPPTHEQEGTFSLTKIGTRYAKKRSRVPSYCIDAWLDDDSDDCDYDDEEDDNKHKFQRRKPTTLPLSSWERAKKLNKLSKILLPRVILSTRQKYPPLQRLLINDDDDNNNNNNTNNNESFVWERKQRAIQFLNSNKSQAIKLITPPFACGPTTGPITIFLVGITTEDGCFVSGRKTRFELGHLYPLSMRDVQIDMSPIAIATERSSSRRRRRRKEEEDESSNDVEENEDNDIIIDDDEDDYSSSTTTNNSDRFMHCLCKFDSVNPFHRIDPTVDDDNGPNEDCIYRGCTGPGLWHCYTAIFDGCNSLIRVDGSTEPQRTREHYGLVLSDDSDENSSSNSSDDDDDDDGNDDHGNSNASAKNTMFSRRKAAGRFVGCGLLDGLSIGSDHLFDMSLCYGEIDGECGQGAISELVVFNGRLDMSDIVKLEDYLMEKHGILSEHERRKLVELENVKRDKPISWACPLHEDEWKRQAHAWMEQQRPPWNNNNIVLDGCPPVPLRVVANHRSVAWHRTNEITGSPIKTERIGAKNSNGSSDW